jgi:hypothetical protein
VEIPGFRAEAQRERLVSVVQIGSVSAEYSTGQRPSGEWFALATLDAPWKSAIGPVRLTIATADSPEEAIQRLTQRIEREAQ